MAFCGKCGAQVAEGTSFCGSCGSAAGGAGAAPAAGGGAGAGEGLSTNVVCALAYAVGLITGVIFLVLDPYKNDRKVRFHCFQSIFFHVGIIGIFIAIMFVSFFLRMIGGGMIGLIFVPIDMLLWFGSFCLWLFLMFKAYNGEEFQLPIIGPLAAKQAGS
jgi:uncharacterized membrane protein